MDGPAAGDRLYRRLQGLLLLRLAVAIVLLGGMLLVALDQGGFSGFTATALTVLIASTFASSAVFGGLLVAKKAASSLVAAQLAFDLLLATGFVYLSGAASSFFTILYGIEILAAAIVATPLGVRITTASSILLYLAVGGAVAARLLPAPPDQADAIYAVEHTQLLFVLLANIFGLSLVGGLAERLATRLDVAGESLKQAEALNQDIVHSLTSGLLTVDQEGRVLTANPAAAAILGAPAEDLIGEPGSRFLPFADGLHSRSEGEATRASGERFPVGFTTAPLLGDRGTLVLFTDLTEIRSLRDAANRSERLAVLGRLSSALAHEIRNPLGSISGSVQLVRDSTGLDQEDKALLDLVLREVDRLNGLVSQMLDVARPPALRRSPTDLRQLCEELIAVARGDDEFAALRIRVEGEAPDISIDADRFRQLLWNLFKNAATASPAGGTVLFELQANDREATLSVSDEGKGIDAASRANLFDMFYSGRDHGIGLGLAVVKQIVESHGGEIRAESSPSGGARFVVVVPRQRDASVAAVH